jgi:hypothetical protein
MLIVLIPFVLLPLLSIPPFILRRDGEWSDPYDGMGKIGRGTARSSEYVLDRCTNYRVGDRRGFNRVEKGLEMRTRKANKSKKGWGGRGAFQLKWPWLEK